MPETYKKILKNNVEKVPFRGCIPRHDFLFFKLFKTIVQEVGKKCRKR